MNTNSMSIREELAEKIRLMDASQFAIFLEAARIYFSSQNKSMEESVSIATARQR